MPTSTTTRHPSQNITLTFTEQDHRYVDDRGTVYTSVTTLIHQYAQPFDGPTTAARMEAQGKGPAADLLAAWDAKRDHACDYGTRVHETAEAILQGRTPPHTPSSEKERIAFAAVWEFCHNKILPRFDILGCEIMVFHPDWYIAGTIDLALREKSTGRKFIADWKTNERISEQGFNSQTMLPPVSHIQDANLNHYGIQLATYQHILTLGGWADPATPFERSIFYVEPNNPTVKPITPPDLRLEAAAILLDNLTGVPF